MADEPKAPNKPLGTSQQSEGSKFTAEAEKSWFERLSSNIPPGDSYVTSVGIVITAAFLILLTVVLLWRIIVLWPVCELPEANRNANAAIPAVASNRNAQQTDNANSSATQASNDTAATNANANAAANGNDNISGPTTTNATANVSAPSTTPNPTPAGNEAMTDLDADSVEPTSGSITGKTLVTIKGKNFGAVSKGVAVKFGEVEAQISQISDKSISVRTPMHSEGIVDVSIERGGEIDVLPSAYTYTCPAPTGSNLFIMLVMAGALGGCIHAMRSFFWYVGQRELKWSWLAMYYTLPFIGAAMAMIFSLLIFAGFVDNTTGRSQSLFIIAVAGLVGMFSQQAALKLTDVANAFFTKPGQGRDAKPQKSLSVGEVETTKLVPLTATKMSVNTGKAGDEVEITGQGFSPSTTVRFGSADATVKTVTPTMITVEAPPGTGKVKVEIKSGKQSVDLPTEFEYIP